MQNSKFDGLRTKPSILEDKPTSKFDGLRTKPSQLTASAKNAGDDWLPFIGKSALKGLSSIGDLPKGLASLGEGAVNLMRKYPTAYHMMTGPRDIEETNYSDNIPAFGTKARKGLEDITGLDLEPRSQGALQNIVGHAVEFAGGMGPLGAAGKGVSIINRFKNAAAAAASGAGVGASSGVMQEAGASPLQADILASIAPNPAQIARMGGNLSRKAIGLAPNRLDLKTARAAQDLGIDLPTAVLTDSKAASTADAVIGKIPFLGDKLKNKYDVAENRLEEILNQTYNKIGPQKNPDKINELYRIAENSLQEGATVPATNTLKSLSQVEQNITKLKTKTADQRAIVSKAEEVFSDIANANGTPEVANLLELKKRLNAEIKWDQPKTAKAQLKIIQQGINKDIEAFGKQNPEWYKDFKRAEDYYAKSSKRQKIEDLLGTRTTNHASGESSYAALSKNIHHPDKELFLRNNTTPETLEDIKKIGTLARAFVNKNARNPNPSGSGTTLNSLSLLASIPTLLYAPGKTLGGGASLIALTNMLTNKKFIDKAIKLAENPNQLNTIAFNSYLKKTTGYSAATLMREIGREEK